VFSTFSGATDFNSRILVLITDRWLLKSFCRRPLPLRVIGRAASVRGPKTSFGNGSWFPKMSARWASTTHWQPIH